MQSGRIAVYGDSNCLDSSHQRSSCYNLLIKLIQFTAEVSAAVCLCILRCGQGFCVEHFTQANVSEGLAPMCCYLLPLLNSHLNCDLTKNILMMMMNKNAIVGVLTWA